MPQQPTSKILIADDDGTIRRLVSFILRKAGFAVVEARTGLETLALATTEEPHLIFLEFSLTGIDGCEVCRRLKSSPATGKIPVIMASALSDCDLIVRAMKAGADDCMVKTGVRPERLLAKITQVLAMTEKNGAVRQPDLSLPPLAALTVPKPSESGPAAPVGSGPVVVSGCLLTRENLDARVAKIAALKALPFVAAEILRITSDARSDAQKLVAAVEMDHALTTTLLRLANSALFQPRTQVHELRHAVVNIGFEGIRKMALGLTLLDGLRLRTHREGRINRLQLWEHSLGCAAWARIIAQRAAYPYLEDAYIAGLLHDVGKALFDDFFTEEYAAVIKAAEGRNIYLREIERKLLGLDHAQIARRLADSWKLPEAIMTPVFQHHVNWSELSWNKPGAADLVAVVKTANILTKASRLGFGVDDLLEDIPDGVCRHLNISTEDLRSVPAELRRHMTYLRTSLAVDMGDDAGEIAEEGAGEPAGDAATVLLVDSARPTLDPVEFVFRSLGCRVETDWNLETGVLRGSPTLILVRVRTTRELEAVASQAIAWREAAPPVDRPPVVLLCSSPPTDELQSLLARVAIAWVTGPLAVSELAARLPPGSPLSPLESDGPEAATEAVPMTELRGTRCD